MAMNALHLVRGGITTPKLLHQHKKFSSSMASKSPLLLSLWRVPVRSFSASSSSLPPPDVSRLAETARISLTPNEVEEFAPKIRQVIDWFGQLQNVDLEIYEPAIRAETEGDSLREDSPEKFENGEAILAAVPSYEKPYIKVPKVLNKE